MTQTEDIQSNLEAARHDLDDAIAAINVDVEKGVPLSEHQKFLAEDKFSCCEQHFKAALSRAERPIEPASE